MSEQAQVGDTVRLMTVLSEGVVYRLGGRLFVNGRDIGDTNGTVEILSRATPPLPSEPGTFWLDCDGDMWKVDRDGVLYCVSVLESVAANYAPFRQLVLNLQTQTKP